MSDLCYSSDYGDIELDNFFKTLMFQRIMDGDFNRDERDVLLVISRKTIHFNKWSDRIGIYTLSKLVGVGLAKTRQTLKQLEAKGLLDIERSKGGRTDSTKKYSEFSLSRDLIGLVVDKWENTKIENDFQ